MIAPDLQTENPLIKLVAPDVSRDVPISLEWLKGEQGRATLKLMGVSDKDNKESSLEAEQKRIENFIRRGDQLNWMIRYDGNIIGAVWVDLEPTEDVPAPAVHIMIGDASARGKGVGNVSIKAVLDYLQKQGADVVYSRNLVKNVVAFKLLSKFGFKPEGKPYIDEDGLEWQNTKLDL